MQGKQYKNEVKTGLEKRYSQKN